MPSDSTSIAAAPVAAPPSPEALVRRRIGGAVLVAHGLLTAATWGAMYAHGHLAQHAVGAAFGAGHVAAGVPIALGKDKHAAPAVLLVAGIWVAALVIAIAWRQTEVSAFHVFWGIAAMALIGGAPGKIRLGGSITVLVLLDVIYMIGAVIRLHMP